MQRSKSASSPLRWDDIQLFLGLLAHPSLSRASASLGLDTSTLSRRLAALEERLGLSLFDRTATGLRVTPAAEKLAAAARHMESSALTFVRESENFERRIEGAVRVSAPPGVVEGLLVPAMARMSSVYSRIVVELDASASYRDLTRREADLAIRTARPTAGTLVSRKVYAGPLWPLGSSAYVRELGTVRSLAEARWVGAEHADVGSAQLADALGLPAPVLRANGFPVRLRAAGAGVGLVLVPRHFGYTFGLAPLQVAPKLKKQLLALPPVELWLVAHESYRRTPRFAAVWSFLEDEFASITNVARERDRAEWT